MEAWRWTSNPAVQQSRIVTHTGVSFASVSPSPSSSHLRASQAVQPNLSSWQDTSVRTSSGPPQSTNSIAVHVAPVLYDHVTTALLRIPATNFQYQPRFLYILPSLLSFPFRFQGWKKRWVGRFEGKRGNGRSWKTTTIRIRWADTVRTNEREWAAFSADRRGWIGASSHFRFKAGICRETWRGIAILRRSNRVYLIFVKCD